MGLVDGPSDLGASVEGSGDVCHAPFAPNFAVFTDTHGVN